MDERKRKRLEAWKKKREEAASVKVSLTLGGGGTSSGPPKKKRKTIVKNPFGSLDDGDDESNEKTFTRENEIAFDTDFPSVLKSNPSLSHEPIVPAEEQAPKSSSRHKKSSKRSKRWDNNKDKADEEDDELDKFMDKLQATAMGDIPIKKKAIDSGGSVMRPTSSKQAMYQPEDWLSDVPMTPETEDDDNDGRMALIEALKKQPAPIAYQAPVITTRKAVLRQEVVSEKARREQRLKELEAAAARASAANEATIDFGRMDESAEDGILEEAEQLFQQAASPDALTVLADLNKKKELTAVDHSKIDYHKFTKNLYRVPRAYAKLTNDEVVNRRAKLHVRVRGQGVPAPVEGFADMGLSEALLKQLDAHSIHKPYPIQAQCIPCIMAGRDVIGIAKTGSGKTLAYILPLLRHVSVQEHSDTPVALILAPARELAFQIHSVCKTYAKVHGLK